MVTRCCDELIESWDDFFKFFVFHMNKTAVEVSGFYVDGEEA